MCVCVSVCECMCVCVCDFGLILSIPMIIPLQYAISDNTKQCYVKLRANRNSGLCQGFLRGSSAL